MATGVTSRNGTVSGNGYELKWPGKRSPEQILSGASEGEMAEALRVGTSPLENRIYWSENLSALRHLCSDSTVRGQVRLVYIDPPYATGRAFICREQRHAYEDTLTGGAFLDFLYERLVLLRELLAEDGSIYLHLDQTMVFEAKLVMDEVFGGAQFRNFITRRKCNRKNYTRKQFGNFSDHILFYSKGADYVWERAYEPWTEESAGREYSCVDELGRRYKKVPVHAPGVRNGATGEKWKGMDPPPGKHWQYTPDRLDEMDVAGEIYWSATGNPRRKIFLEDSPGIPVQDIWLDVKDPHNQNSKVTGYPTEKEISLLERIVRASSRPGDLVLDAFMGSGTTLEAAAMLKRRFIGIDASTAAVDATIHRLVHGRAPMGDFVSARSGAALDQHPAPMAVPDTDAPGFVVFTGTVDATDDELDSRVRRWTNSLAAGVSSGDLSEAQSA
tara:strand:- start:64 stop:1395 length:1332 start_codon:yes stop_codon:yes gene_type:complete